MIPLKDDNPTRSWPLVTVGLIIVNVIVFLYQLSLGRGFGAFMFKMGAIPYELTRFTDIDPQVAFPLPLTLLTSQFLHGGFLHLIGNMLYLWIFGDNIEDIMGHFRFFIFYLLCGILAATTHILTNINSEVPMVGASGAIAGVLGAYLVRYPRAKVSVLFFFFFIIRIIKVPAMFVLGFWIVIQVLSGLGSLNVGGGGVAWFAHIGGFLAGILLLKVFERKSYRVYG